MATKKKAAGKKAGSKVRRDDLELGMRTVTPADEEGHSPIIITDGSASVEFDGRAYAHVGNGRHFSLGLRLDRVEARRVPGGSVIHVCRTFSGTDRHLIVARCMLDNVPTDIIIEGAKRPSPGSLSPSVDFRRGLHFNESGNFPPKGRFGRRFGNANARIISFTITNLVTGDVHNCPLVTTAGFEFTILDGHA